MSNAQCPMSSNHPFEIRHSAFDIPLYLYTSVPHNHQVNKYATKLLNSLCESVDPK